MVVWFVIYILWWYHGNTLGAGNLCNQISFRKRTNFSLCCWEIKSSNVIFFWQIWYGTKTISNNLNLVVMFTFPIRDQKYPFFTNLFEKINGILSNCNTMHLMVGVIFFCFRPERFFVEKFGPKIQNCWPKVNFGPSANLKMYNLEVKLTFSFLDQKRPFRASLDQKLQTFLVKFVPWLIPIWRIRWSCCFSTWMKAPFFGQICSNNQNFFFKVLGT